LGVRGEPAAAEPAIADIRAAIAARGLEWENKE
jgi:hypothetical protein